MTTYVVTRTTPQGTTRVAYPTAQKAARAADKARKGATMVSLSPLH